MAKKRELSLYDANYLSEMVSMHPRVQAEYAAKYRPPKRRVRKQNKSGEACKEGRK